MTNYNNLTQEQKESINPKLRKLFEGIENALAFPEVNMYCYHIEGFQEGLKMAIKIIDDEIEKIIRLKLNIEERTIRFKDYTSIKKEVEKETSIRIEELKKQKEQLQFEVELK